MITLFRRMSHALKSVSREMGPSIGSIASLVKTDRIIVSETFDGANS